MRTLSLLLATALLTGCGGDAEPEPVTLAHVHGLGVNPADQKLYVATHHGVFRLDDQGRPEPVGAGRQDTMGFTVAGPDRFLGSGHPAPGENGPPHLGLIESTDAGRTWRTVSLRGEADFHALVAAHNRVYGWNSTTGQLLVSTDGGTTWERRPARQLISLAVDPAHADHLLGAGPQGLLRSRDGGRTWQPLAAGGPGPALLGWDREAGLFAADFQQRRLYASADGGQSWQLRATLPGQPAALAVTPDAVYFATAEGAVVRSRDGGQTWHDLYRPPR